MKLTVRRVGNSLGIILPKDTLVKWGVGEGDELELTERGVRPAARGGLSHQGLDELKRRFAIALIRSFTAREIRAQMLANLHQWKQQGTWGPAYDEWQVIAKSEDDGELFAVMLGRDENAVRLRQSMPGIGLLSEAEVRQLNEEAGS